MNEKKIAGSTEADTLQAIHETLNGNTAAFSYIVESYTPLVYSLSYSILGKHHEAEEAVQEIFLKIYTGLSRFNISRRFLPWMYTIALNYLRSRLRKIKKRLSVLSIDEIGYNNRQISPGKDPLDRFAEKEEEILAKKAVTQLRKKYREVFILRQIEGLSVSEVSSILAIPEGTVKTYLHRAKKDLVAILMKMDIMKP
ncbi:MAG: RNA polymerase sigma factor [Spirochaetales bacterium]|nr:RNA polymerase sigma factor [Spirochaetales bacterium]